MPRPSSAAASARLVYARGAGAETCPGEESVRTAVRSRLGYDPFFFYASILWPAGVQGSEGATVMSLAAVYVTSVCGDSPQLW